jgi:cytochrome c oxidase cbb3-type subunit 2
MMPQYPYLFIKRKITGERSVAALAVPAKYVEDGYEIVPTREANALVAYLTTLHASTYLLEAPQLPPPPPKTNAAPNAAAAAAPAK